MPKQVVDKDGKVCCDRLLSAHSANIIILLVVFISHKILFGEAVLRRVACCATPPSVPITYATAVVDELRHVYHRLRNH